MAITNSHGNYHGGKLKARELTRAYRCTRPGAHVDVVEWTFAGISWCWKEDSTRRILLKEKVVWIDFQDDDRIFLG